MLSLKFTKIKNIEFKHRWVAALNQFAVIDYVTFDLYALDMDKLKVEIERNLLKYMSNKFFDIQISSEKNEAAIFMEGSYKEKLTIYLNLDDNENNSFGQNIGQNFKLFVFDFDASTPEFKKKISTNTFSLDKSLDKPVKKSRSKNKKSRTIKKTINKKDIANVIADLLEEKSKIVDPNWQSKVDEFNRMRQEFNKKVKEWENYKSNFEKENSKFIYGYEDDLIDRHKSVYSELEKDRGKNRSNILIKIDNKLGSNSEINLSELSKPIFNILKELDKLEE
jgi:hypothetical protein